MTAAHGELPHVIANTRLTGADRELRVALAVAQLGGLLNLLFRQEDPIVTGADADRVVALYGDAIQHLLTPERSR